MRVLVNLAEYVVECRMLVENSIIALSRGGQDAPQQRPSTARTWAHSYRAQGSLELPGSRDTPDLWVPETLHTSCCVLILV